jgi:uncharacterized membrane protein
LLRRKEVFWFDYQKRVLQFFFRESYVFSCVGFTDYVRKRSSLENLVLQQGLVKAIGLKVTGHILDTVLTEERSDE